MTVREEPRSNTKRWDGVSPTAESLNSLSDWPVDGILSHAAGPTNDGWRVVDVWRSAEAFERFGPVIGPLLQEVGFPGEPQVFPLHNFVR